MYELENNVQWTQGLKNAFKNGITRASIIYDNTEINEESNLVSLSLEEQRYISSLGFVGSATARKLEVNLIDNTETINLENKELTLKIGADYKSKNLFNINSTPVKNSVVVSVSDNTLTQRNTGTYCRSAWKMENLIVGNQYTLSYSFINENGCSIQARIMNSANSSIIEQSVVTTETSGSSTVTFTATDTTHYFRLYSNTLNTSNTATVIYNNIQFENSSIVTSYEPYFSGTVYINYGNFIVDKPPENDTTNGKIRVVAYDYMIKFDKPFVSTVTYPCKLIQLLQDVCNQAGVTLATTDFANSEFWVADNQFEGATLREVLQNIAKCAFSWARIGQDNRLYLDFNQNVESTETITTDDYFVDSFKKANEYYGPVNQVIYADSYMQGQEEKVPSETPAGTLKELVIYDNLFAYTQAKREELIQAGTRLLNLTYMPITELNLIGLAYLDCNDGIEISTLSGDTFTSRVFNHKIEYNGSLTDSIVTEGTSNNEQTYKNTAADAFQNQRTQIIVDKANQTITMVAETVDEQNNKISIVEKTVNELNSKISDIADITTSQETSTGRLLFEGINQSEPIRVEIRPLGQNITYLYPRNNLYPADNLYITLRTLRFTNTSTSEIFDYELPDDLLYYDAENYDEFILDYDSLTVIVNKKCGYDTNGNVVLLSQPRTDTYTFPHIYLTDGDYTVEVLKYDNTVYTTYLFCRLMAQNIYTTQFATRAEVNSEISQTAQAIDLSVNQKLSNYSTTTQMNSAIALSANQIQSSVSNVYATKTALTNEVETLNSTITQTESSITSEVRATYETKADAETTEESLSSRIRQNESSITAEVGRATTAERGLSASIELKIDKSDNGQVISMINAAADEITLAGGSKINLTSAGKLIITAGNFRLDANGNVTCTNGNFSGTITSSSGTIGGFSIGAHAITCSSGTYYGSLNDMSGEDFLVIRTGTSGNYNYPFFVHRDGYLSATNAHISGTITASNLTNNTFSSGTISNSSYTASGVSFSPSVSRVSGFITYSNQMVVNNAYGTMGLGVGTDPYGGVTTNNVFVENSNGDYWCTMKSGNNSDDMGLFTNGTVFAYNIKYYNLTPVSKEEDKKDFERLDNEEALKIVLNTDIYKYHYKQDEKNSKKRLGFVIGDKYNYSSAITSEEKGEETGADIYSMTSACYGAIQKLYEEIEKLKEK